MGSQRQALQVLPPSDNLSGPSSPAVQRDKLEEPGWRTSPAIYVTYWETEAPRGMVTCPKPGGYTVASDRQWPQSVLLLLRSRTETMRRRGAMLTDIYRNESLQTPEPALPPALLLQLVPPCRSLLLPLLFRTLLWGPPASSGPSP